MNEWGGGMATLKKKKKSLPVRQAIMTLWLRIDERAEQTMDRLVSYGDPCFWPFAAIVLFPPRLIHIYVCVTYALYFTRSPATSWDDMTRVLHATFLPKLSMAWTDIAFTPSVCVVLLYKLLGVACDWMVCISIKIRWV